MIEGVVLTPLKVIAHPKGDLMLGMKRSDPGFVGFGEAYFSSISQGFVKGWKQHREMVLNLVVPLGQIRFVIFDDRMDSSTKGRYYETVLGDGNYCRLTVQNGLWMAFQGIGGDFNLLLNMASIEHNHEESNNRELSEIEYDWSIKRKFLSPAAVGYWEVDWPNISA